MLVAPRRIQYHGPLCHPVVEPTPRFSFSSVHTNVHALLYGFEYAGNLTAVARCSQLERIQLNDVPNIKGQVSAIANLTNLQGLGLAGTSVGGDLMSLAGLATLRGLRLDGSKVRRTSF